MSTGQGDATAKLCVPADDALCACRPSWHDLGLETQCFNSNGIGACVETRSCDADGLSACNAPEATTCSDDSECITNATCTNGACRCVVGYAGSTCQLCATGYQDKDRDGTCLPSCAITVCVQGVCADGGGTAICTCNEGHIGAACDTCDAPNYTDPDGDGLCVIRGDVLLGAAPGTVARVAKVYRFVMSATQEGFMPGDAFVYSLTTAPTTMTIDAVTGETAWTPSPSEQTWDEDPTLSTTFHLTIRATAPDGQYAEHNRNSLYLAKAHANGTVDAESLCAPIFGIGAPGSFVADRPTSAQSVGVTSVTVDGGALIVSIGERVIRLTL